MPKNEERRKTRSGVPSPSLRREQEATKKLDEYTSEKNKMVRMIEKNKDLAAVLLINLTKRVESLEKSAPTKAKEQLAVWAKDLHYCGSLIKDKTEDAAKAVKDFTVSTTLATWKTAANVTKTCGRAINTLFKKLWEGIETIGKGVGGAVGVGCRAISDLLKKAAKAIGNTFEGITNSLSNLGQKLSDGVKSTRLRVADVIKPEHYVLVHAKSRGNMDVPTRG